jgi:hypothetical protein
MTLIWLASPWIPEAFLAIAKWFCLFDEYDKSPNAVTIALMVLTCQCTWREFEGNQTDLKALPTIDSSSTLQSNITRYKRHQPDETQRLACDKSNLDAKGLTSQFDSRSPLVLRAKF